MEGFTKYKPSLIGGICKLAGVFGNTQPVLRLLALKIIISIRVSLCINLFDIGYLFLFTCYAFVLLIEVDYEKTLCILTLSYSKTWLIYVLDVLRLIGYSRNYLATASNQLFITLCEAPPNRVFSI